MLLAELLDPATHTRAETEFERVSTQQGAGPWLLKVARNAAEPKAQRLMALVLLRRMVKTKWRLGNVQQRRLAANPELAASPEFAVLSALDKAEVQGGLLEAVFHEPDELLAVNLGRVVAAIVHHDWLAWPELMQRIVQSMQPSGATAQVKIRATRLLRTCVKDLASKRLATEIGSFTLLCAELCAPLVRQLGEAMNCNAALAYQTAKCLFYVVPHGAQLSTEPARDVLLKCLHVYVIPCPSADLVTCKLWRCLAAIPQESLCARPVDFASLHDGLFERFVRTCAIVLVQDGTQRANNNNNGAVNVPTLNVLASLRFLTQCFSIKELRPMSLLPGVDLEELCHVLVTRTLCLSPTDVKLWAAGPELAAELDDSLTPEESPRAAAANLVSVLCSDERTRAIITSIVLQHVQASRHAQPNVMEAVLYAAGLVAFRLRWSEQAAWLVDTLLPFLTDTACSSIVQKRAAWTCARFLADFSPVTRPLACQALLHAVEFGSDFAVRVSAAEALGDFIRDVDFDPACMDAMRITRATLAGLAQAESTEAKVKMLDVLLVLSDKLGARYFRDAVGEHCLQTLGPHVYAAHSEDAGLIKFPLLRLMRVILGALGYENVQANTQAVIRKVVEWTLAKEVGFAEDGLALWLVVLKSATTYSEAVHDVCMRVLRSVRAEDCTGILTTMIFLGGPRLVAHDAFASTVAWMLTQGVSVADACAVLDCLLRVAPAETLCHRGLADCVAGAVRDALREPPHEPADAVDLLAVAALAVTRGWDVGARAPLVTRLLANMSVLGRNVAFAIYRRRLFASAMLRLVDDVVGTGVAQACAELEEDWVIQPKDPWPLSDFHAADCLDADVDFDLQRRLVVFAADVVLNSNVMDEMRLMGFDL